MKAVAYNGVSQGVQSAARCFRSKIGGTVCPYSVLGQIWLSILNSHRLARRAEGRAAKRPKSPMPPARALEFLGIDSNYWRDSGDLKSLSRFAGRLAVARAPNLFDADALLGRPYTHSLACAIATPWL